MDRIRKELIKGYMEKADDKLTVSHELLKHRHYEDAVSRAYYAAFHAAQAALTSEGQQADTHKGVVTLFGLFLVKTGKIEKRYGRLLANLKDDRETGDYEAFSYIDEDTAKRAVAEAEMFFQAVEQYLKKIKLLR